VFCKPIIVRLDFTSLVLEQRPFLVLTWKVKYGFKLRVDQTHITFYGKEGSAVVLLQSPIDVAVISISNIWRTRKISLALKHTSLDSQTAAFLMKQIREVKRNGEVVWNLPSQQIVIYRPLISFTGVPQRIQHPYINIKASQPFFNKHILIQSPKFN
jgi:hypothetical protein